MNKTQLIEQVAVKANFTKKVSAEAVDAVLETLTEALKEGAGVKLTGFGNFTFKERKERKGRNPSTGETITIPATTVISFKASKALTE